MTFVPEKNSVTTQQTIVHKPRVRSKVLPCFSKIPFATKPFFKQWYIHTIDVTKIMFIPPVEARLVIQELREYFGKSKRDVITVEEFCAFTGISKSYVRMHLVSRAMEHELKRQVNRVIV
ncbi:hypothetical protein FAM09_22105 [Niastella caeni]|uniref:Uncharacterized protein n=1 Tax=Niastella caeni TaxID=2569763 RepID=A0A4S8HMZ0_9BACT|nr:hypothetical protein [Niastella caeni]THU36081.1 hypothetical protein FAM09_22105 [Niastella caeni]